MEQLKYPEQYKKILLEQSKVADWTQQKVKFMIWSSLTAVVLERLKFGI